MTKGRVAFPGWIGCGDPRSQQRDLGHPSIVSENASWRLTFQWDGCGGSTNYQFGTHDVGDAFAFSTVAGGVKRSEGEFGDFCARQADRRQGRRHEAAEGNVVKAYDGNICGNGQADSIHGAHDADGREIVRGQYGCRTPRQLQYV